MATPKQGNEPLKWAKNAMHPAYNIDYIWLETNLERNTKYNGTCNLIAFFYSSLYPSKYEHCTSLTCQLLF